MRRKILNVGQCEFDHATISRMLRGLNAEPVKIDLHSQVLAGIQEHDPVLVLINRVNDSDGTLGLDLIKVLKQEAKTARVPVMLISNYSDAQDAAQAAGALKGFGKSEIGSREVLEMLRSFLDTPTS